MFWGVTILSGRRYTQTVEKSYHISKAALEIPVDGKNPGKRVQLMLEQNKTHFLLSNLDSEKIVQVDLDLIFTEGEEVTFYLNGDGVVHLSGYVLDFDDGDDFDEEFDDEEGLSDEESEDEKVTNANAKRVLNNAESASAKKAKVDSAAKAVAVNGVDDDDDEDDDILGNLDEEFESDEEDDEEDDEEEEEDEVPQPKPVQKQVNGQAAKAQQQKGTPGKQNQPQQNAKNIGSAGKPNQQSPKGGQPNQNKFGQKGQNTPQGQKQSNQNQKGGQQQQQQQQQKGQGNQNKQPFNKQKGSFTPDQKASKGNFNKFNKNKGRKSFN